MKRFAAVALLVAWIALPAFSQRGMSHGGGFSSGHSAGAFRGGFSSPQFSRGFAAPRSYGFTGGARYSRPFTAYPNSRFRSGFRTPYSGTLYRADRYRRPYLPVYAAPFFYPIPDWIGLGPIGCYSDGNFYGNSDESFEGCDTQPAETEPPVIHDENEYERPSYQPLAEAQPPSKAPENEIATTIVFKDGRPSEQIHNYALTRTTLYVLDEQHRDIPLDQINLVETERVNRATGIEFQVPRIAQ